jgi:hypothetical protein
VKDGGGGSRGQVWRGRPGGSTRGGSLAVAAKGTLAARDLDTRQSHHRPPPKPGHLGARQVQPRRARPPRGRVARLAADPPAPSPAALPLPLVAPAAHLKVPQHHLLPKDRALAHRVQRRGLVQVHHLQLPPQQHKHVAAGLTCRRGHEGGARGQCCHGPAIQPPAAPAALANNCKACLPCSRPRLRPKSAPQPPPRSSMALKAALQGSAVQ